MHTIARDFLIGLALFMLICSVNLAATEPPAPLVLANAVRTSLLAALIELGACWRPDEAGVSLLSSTLVEHDRALVILGLVFSGMVAFNLWFVRHVRCAYGSRQGPGWGSGQ